MDIEVSIKCLDRVIRVKYNDLIKYKFFKTLLTNFNTKMTHYTETQAATNDIRVVEHYIIPQLGVDCKSTTLLKLLYPEEIQFEWIHEKIKSFSPSLLFMNRSQAIFRVEVEVGNYEDDLIELIMYNNMYEFNHIININRVKDFNGFTGDLPFFVKQKLPAVNVFNFLQNCWRCDDWIDHYLQECSKGTIDHSLIPDLLEYHSYGFYGTGDPNYYGEYRLGMVIVTLKAIVYCHENGFDTLVMSKIDTNKIKTLIMDILPDEHKELVKSAAITVLGIREYYTKIHTKNIEDTRSIVNDLNRSKIFDPEF